MKRLILLLMIIGLAVAQSDAELLPGERTAPSEGVLDLLSDVYALVIPFMFTMVALAAAAYVIGQMFGAETRAKATVWAQGMLAAVGVSALVLIMLSFIVPAWESGGIPSIDVRALITQLENLAATSLAFLTFVLVVLAGLTYAIGQIMGAETRARANVWATGLLSGAIVSAVIYVLLFQVLIQLRGVLAGTVLADYADVVISVTFFVSFFILITYLMSKVFKIPEWEAYLSIELSNLLASFLIVLFVLGMFAVGSAVAAIYSENLSPPRAALEYLSTVLDDVLQGIFDIYQIQACTSMLSTISRRIGEMVLTQTYKVFPGLDTFVQISNVIAFGLVSVYGSLSAQIGLLYLIDSTMVRFFLPAGLILRFFPPTRDAGAFLISVAFGFQIIFPTTYLMNKAILEDLQVDSYDSPVLLIQSICGPFKLAAYGVIFNPATNPLFQFPGTQALGVMLGRLFSESLLNFISMSEFVQIMRHVSVLSLLSLFMPALSMLITIAFINAMTKFILAKV